MDLVTFKNTQGPIRERYAGDAKAALLTLRAQGSADDAAVTVGHHDAVAVDFRANVFGDIRHRRGVAGDDRLTKVGLARK